MSTNPVILTGARPTGQLHVGNYLGAIQPVLELSRQYSNVRLFAATLHSFTDQDPSATVGMVYDLIRDYLAAGIDPDRVIVFDQMAIAREIALATLYLARLVTVNRLMVIPTLKDKLKPSDGSGSANGLLLYYPVMMAADIILQDTSLVPVGIDQRSHIEFTRDMVGKMRLETRRADVLTMPDSLIQESLNVLALDGTGKMSKTKPESAIFLGEQNSDVTAKKIKRATSCSAGTRSDAFQSLYTIGSMLVGLDKRGSFESIVSDHDRGLPVMAQFKDALIEIVGAFISGFCARRESVSDELISKVLLEGAEKARHSANSVLDSIEVAMTGSKVSSVWPSTSTIPIT